MWELQSSRNAVRMKLELEYMLGRSLFCSTELHPSAYLYTNFYFLKFLKGNQALTF